MVSPDPSASSHKWKASLANLVGTNTVEWGTLLSYATLAMLPVLVVFLCFQRYFLKGSLSGGVKG
jgi:alpha-1,4-digalacturonate transport system permease protein